jgi:hypothetical protein
MNYSKLLGSYQSYRPPRWQLEGPINVPFQARKPGNPAPQKTVTREAPFYHEQRSHNRVTGSKYITISSQLKVPLTFSLPRCLFHYVPTLYLFLFQPWRVASEGESDSRGKYGLNARFLQSARLQSWKLTEPPRAALDSPLVHRSGTLLYSDKTDKPHLDISQK